MGVLYFLLTILMLGVLIFVHEGGHFLVARLNGITVNEFAIGMGPKILSHVSIKSNIRYSLRLFPIGGFVSMAGEDEDSEDENAFYKKNVWRRISTVLAGPVTNILVGFLGMFILVLITGQMASTVVAGFQAGATSCDTGLMVEDKVVSVNGVRVLTGDELVYEIMSQGYEPIEITVIRNGKEVTLTRVTFPTMEEDGAQFGSYDIILFAEEKTVGTVMRHAYGRSISTVKMIWDSLTGLVSGRYGLSSLSGPIGITQTVGEAAQTGGRNLLYLFVIIAINLGVMNLLPVPALDGGRLIFLLIEAIIRRPLNRKVESFINFGGLVALLAMMVLITAKDIVNLL